MKKFIPIFIFLLTIVNGQDRFAKKGKTVSAQKDAVEKMSSTSNQPVPRRISYQGLITKADGSPTDDGSYEILFKVYGTADGGEAVWSENQEVTVNNGIISTILGNTNPFTVIPPEAFLELTVAGSTLSPRQVLTSVFYSVLSDTSAYAKTANYESLSNLPDLDIYVLKDSLENYATSADLYDTLSAYQKLDSNLTDLVEDGLLSASKVEYGISSAGDSGQTWISDGDGAGTWGNPASVAADDIIIGDGNISIQTINGGISIVPSDGYNITLDSTITIDGNLMGLTNDSDLLTFSRDTLTVRGTVMASTIGGFAVLDEDDMVSDSELQLATQQSIKAYADSKQSYNENLEAIGLLEHGDGNFLVSNGSEWTVESDSVARASLGLGSIAMLESDNMDINGGTIDGTIIGSENPQVGNFTTVQAESRAYIGDMIIDSGSITSESGTVSFGNETITTDGTLSSGSGSTIGNLTLADGSISSASNQIDFGDDDLATIGTLSTGTATLGSGSTIGNLTFTDGTIASGSDNISFGNENLSTNGTLTAGVSTLSSGSEIGDLTISNGSITSSSDAIDFGNDALSTTGTLSTGTATLATGSTVGNLTLADGSITSSSNAIDFGNDALSTTGTLSAGAATLATGSTVGNLTLADGSITSSSNAIDFGNNTLTTSSTITANAFAGDGSNITGVEASSMGILSGVSPIVLEGESINDFETILSVEDPTLSDKTITFPNATGTIITTGNDSAIDEVGTITSGEWQGTPIADAYVPNDITLSGATIDNSVIGGNIPVVATVTTITTNDGIVPDESDGAVLGTSSAEFSDIFLADGAVINLGDEQDVTLTHVEDTGIQLNGSSQIQFGDSGTQISQSTDGVLDLVSDNEVEINGTTIDMNGAVDISGAVTTSSTITTTGSLLPSSVDGAGLGSSAAEFSDVFLADGALINLGNNQDVTLTHIKDTGIKINDANQIQFGDSGTQISQSADGVLDLVSDNEVEINGITIDINGVVEISGAVTTGSTITTTGSLLPALSDGAGLGSSAAEFSDVFLADGAVINLGDNQEVTLTHIEDEGLRLNTLSQMQFGDSGTKISQSADGVLDLVSDNEVEINGTTIDINGNTTLDNATIDFLKLDGTYVGHVDDTDLMNLANGTLTVSGTLAATTFSGDGSNLTGISASSIKSDDISQGDAVVNITTSSGAININPASGSPVLIDNTINIDGSLIGHADDTDLMNLANGSVTFTGTTIVPTADVNGGAIDGVTLGTNSAVTQAVVDNVNIDGALIGHTSDTDLMTLADGSVTFTGTTVVPTADVNGGTIDGVTLGTNSAVTQAVVDNVNIDGALIGHTSDTDLMTLADGSVTFTGTTVVPTADVNGGTIDGVTLGTNSAVTQAVVDNVNIDGALIGHTSDTDLMTLADGSVTFTGTTVVPTADVNGGTIDGVTLGTNSAVTQAVIDNINLNGVEIGHTDDTDLMTLADGSVTFTGTTVVPIADINGGAIDAVTLGTSSPITQAVIDNINMNGAQIGHATDTDLMTLSNGTLTVAGTVAATTVTGDGSGLTGITASEMKSDDISQGDAAVTISTSSGAVNINPASGSPILLDNTINIDGSLIGHTDDTDLMTLADGSVTFTGSTVITTADVNGGAIDAVTLGTNSAVTQAVIDNVNINGAEIGHTLDTDLMTLADGSVTFTGSTVIPTVDVNGGAIDAVTLGTNSAVTQAVIDNVSINGSTIGHTDDTDLLTLANGVATVAGEISVTTLDIGGADVTSTAAELNKLDNVTATTTELNYVDVTTLGTSEASKAVTVDANGDLLIPDSDKYKFGAGSDMQLYHDGSDSYITNATGEMKVATETSGIAITIGHSTSEATIGDNLTVGGDAAVTGDVTITGNDITFGNGETISNATDGDFLFTTGTQTGALTIKNSNTTDGIASLELVSDNSGDVGDGYELKSVNGTFTVTSDHSTKGTYEDTYLTIVGNSTPASSSTTIAGDLTIAGDDLTMGTNTSGAALIGDGTNYNPVVISGDLSIGTDGTAAIGSGVIVNADINGSAAITDSKLATITTADKVSGAAIQVDGATSGTGITLADDDKFLVDDGGTTKYVNASQVLSYASATSSTDINGGTIDGVTLGTNSAVTQAVIDNVNIDGALIGHTSDTDLMTLADGSVTFTGTTVIPTADINGGTIDGVTLGTNSAVTRAVVDNVNIDGALIGHTSDTDLMTLADGSVTFTGSTVVPNADVNGGTIDGVTLGTNSAVTQAVVDNINMDGAQIGHTDDTDLMTLANNSVTFTGTTVIPTADVNGGAVDGVTLGTISAVTQAVIDNVNINGDEIGHTSDTDLMTLADGSVTFTGTTVIPTADINGGTIDGVTLGTNSAVTRAVVDNVNIDGALIGHTSDTDLMTLADGSVTFTGSTVVPNADVNGGTIDGVTLGTNSAVTRAVIDNVNIDGTTIGHTSDTDLLTLSSGVMTLAGNLTFENGESVSNATDGDFLFTTNVTDGALVLKNSNATDGTAKIELVSDNADNAGDGYEIKSVNGTFTVTSDHSSSGTYNDTYLTIDGNATPASSTTKIAGDLLVDGGQIALTGDTDLITLSSGVVEVAGELSATTLDINGTDITSTATELNFNDGTSAGTVVASKTVVVDANKDIASFRNITLTGELDAGSLDISGDADIDGTLEADAITVNGSSLASVIQGTTVNSATTGTNVVITDNESTAETNAIVFVANADLDGNSSVGLESDGDLHYNPSTGTVTATAFVGDGSNLTGITASTIGTLTAGNAISFRDSDLNINSSTDGQLDINADNTLDIAAPTTLMSGDLTISGNDLSFGNSETISNQTDNTIAITANTTSLSGDLTVTGNDITFGNGETISNATDGDFIFTTGTANGALTLKNSNASDGKAAIELVSDNANEVGDGYEIQSLNGVFTVTGDHSTSGTYDDTFITVNGNSTPSSSYTTIAGDLRVDGGEIGISGDTDLIALASGRATVDGELVVTSLDIGGTDITSTPAELNIIDGNTSATGTTVAGADRVVLNDAGTMVQVAMTDIDTYISGTSKTLTNKTLTSPVVNTPTITGNTTFSDGGYNFNIASHDGTNGLALAGTVITASASELNKLDGGTSATNTTVADADRVVLNDAGSMIQVAMTDIDTYISGTTKTLTNKTLTSPVINTPTITGNTTFSDGAYDFNIASHDGTNGLALGGTVVNATAEELNTYVLNVSLDDISTASSCYVVAPKAGTLTRIYSVIDGTIGTADAVITANVNGGSNVTQTLTIANGSNAGIKDDCTPADNNTVAAGEFIQLTTNGASTNSVSAVFSLVITH